MDDLNRALQSLPHGEQFRFVDRLISLDAGKRGAGEYHVRGDEVFLRGHFPDSPLFPGVLLVEGCAQLAGVVAQCDPQIPPLKSLKLTAIRGAKILGSATPGQTIEFRAEITGRLANLIQARARATVDGKIILETDVTLSGDPS